MPKNDYQKFFPFESYRPGQERAICEAIDRFEDGAENVIIEAPTGTGKTPIAITVSRYLTSGYADVFRSVQFMLTADEAEVRQTALEELGHHQSHLITNMKMLQRQYLNDGPDVILMMGKSNYRCEKRLTHCEEAESIYNSMCRNCTYRQAREDAQAARLTLHNFNSFFNQAALGKSFPARKLLCMDEAHDAEEKIIGVISFELTDKVIERMFPSVDWTFSDLTPNRAADKMDEIKAMFDRKKTEVGTELDNLQQRFTAREMDAESKSIAKQLSSDKKFCEETVRKVGRFVDTNDTIDWAVEKQGGGFSFEPVSARPFMHHSLLKFGQHKLFLSATFLDPEAFCGAVKVPFKESNYISVPCSFPVERRRIIPVPAGDMGHKKFDESWPKALTAIKKICDLHKGERGIIHCTSYKVARLLEEENRLPEELRSRLFFHESRGRDKSISSFMNESNDDAILVGVSVNQGYDFKGDMCRFQIVVRMPYPYPSKRVMMRKDVDPKYYDWRTSLTLVQTYGRGTRSAEDQCVTYVLDSRFDTFVKRNSRILPGWFTEAITKRRHNKDRR